MKKEFTTTDFAMAVYMITKGKTLIRIDRVGNQGFFVFDQKQIGSEALDYSSGRALVDPLQYSLATRKLKAELNAILR